MRKLVLLFTLLTLLIACGKGETGRITELNQKSVEKGKETLAMQSDQQRKKYNRLGEESSPYLQQHKDNPIWWYPWGDEAFETARRENKPIFLSIGYSSCYWCHFMEKDVFEKDDVAAILNKSFISIKVDREERPDVDKIYMAALVAMRGRGGWPISIFLTPDGKPFYAESTIPHDRFISLLKLIVDTWEKNPDKIIQGGEQVQGVLERYLVPEGGRKVPPGKVVDGLTEESWDIFDKEYGGFGGGNKFPRPHLLRSLLRAYKHSNDKRALEMVEKTVDSYVSGGTHDWVGGGFHRYSVDRFFNVPHFEKMLYDNAGFLSLLAELYQVTGKEEYRWVAEKTFRWLKREMLSPEGAFYSALDAGEYQREGEYYVWKYSEIEKILKGKEWERFLQVFDLSKKGNFEGGRNTLVLRADADLKEVLQDRLIQSALEKLRLERDRREFPRKDDKRLTAWNGMMVAALAQAYQVWGNEEYLRAAQTTARYLLEKHRLSDGRLIRTRYENGAIRPAILNDYAYLIDGLIELYQADFDPVWLQAALDLQEVQNRYFLDHKNGGYFYSDGSDGKLALRPKEFEDMALASGNSVSALNLMRLADYTYDKKFTELAEGILEAGKPTLEQSVFSSPWLVAGVYYYWAGSKEIAIVGGQDDAAVIDFLNVVRRDFYPAKVVALGPTSAGFPALLENKQKLDGKATVYVCESGSCKLPVTDSNSLRKQLQ